MFQLRHKNMMRVAHSYRKKVTRKSTLEYKLDYDEHITRASRSNTGTDFDLFLQFRFGRVRARSGTLFFPSRLRVTHNKYGDFEFHRRG